MTSRRGRREPESERGGGVGDTGAPGPPGAKAEPRWPMATAVLAATILYVAAPHRGRVPGWWLFPLVQLVLLGLLIAQDPAGSTAAPRPCSG